MMVDNIKRPVDYKHFQYAVFYDVIYNQGDRENNGKDYQKDYPGMKIYHIHHKTVFDMENVNDASRITLLQALQNDSSVRCIVKLISKTDGESNFHIFNNKIYCVMPTTVEQEHLVEKAKQFDFEYVATEAVSSYTHYFRYKNKLWDENAMEQFNKLYQSYPYYDFKIDFYINTEPDRHEVEKQ